MCGIVGCVMKGKSGFYKKNEDIFFELLFADQVRGEDSTGIIGVEKDGQFHIAKEAVKASEFIPKIKATTLTTGMWNNGKAYIGHNRKKTVGKVDDESAHPFVVDDTFAMVHNGTLEKHYELAKGFSVDSEALAHHLAGALKTAFDEGDTKTEKHFEDALAKIEGAYAVAMYDQRRHKIFLTRNKERPLSLIETDDAWYFMSESLMGVWLLCRGYPARYQYDKIKVSSIEEHEVVTFNLESGTMGRVQLHPVKKYKSSTTTPPWTTTQHGGQTSTPTTKKGGPSISEAEFKTFRKTFVGKRVSIIINDLLEEYYPQEKLEWGNVTSLILYATCPTFDFMHCITIFLDKDDMKKFGVKTEEDVLGKKWMVDIESASLSVYGNVLITTSDPKPVVTGPLKLVGNETNKEFRANLSKLTYEELHAVAEEVKYQTQQWQINAVNAEISWRDGISTLEVAAAKAATRGIVLQQIQKNGKFIYQDSEGNIYYETAIALQ